MRVAILGPVSVGVGGGSGGAAVGGGAGDAVVGSRSQRLVLALLAASPGETVSADHLVDALWADDAPRTAQHSLRTYVSRLRRRLGDTLAIRPGGYALDVPAGAVDAARFEALCRQAAGTAVRDPAGAADLYDEALGLWRGPAFGDLADEEALRGAARRLEELRASAREARAAVLLAAGRAADAAAAAEELVAEHPLREEAWAVLVDALAAGGRVPEALRAYQRAAAALADAGLVPSPRLREAESAALRGTDTAPPAPRRLPVPVSSLVGRDGDLDALERLLTRARVVTLCGPGGVGKTRLALAVADRVASRFQWGARLVALASVDDPAAVAGAVVDALGLAPDGGTADAALAAAGALDLLVVLDNAEHVVGEAARVAELVVTGGGRARVLATSRERLGVAGEHVWTVWPLAAGGADSPAGRLFLERLGAVRPPDGAGDDVRADADGGPDADPDGAVERIVRRLDGLPLAIEMAAARAATLPLPELADRLDDLEGLTSPHRAGEPRHRTLAAVVEWSEALLSAEERDLFADLSVFAGPVGAGDVEAVTGRPGALDTLCRLAERSLLVADPSGRTARFGMLGTVRAHASRRLAAAPARAAAVARRHAEHVARLAAEADGRLRGADEADAAADLEALTDELRAAHRFARSAEPAIALRLSAALHLFAQSRLRNEPLGWAAGLVDDGLLDGATAAAPGAGSVLASAAQRAVNAGDLRRAEALAERGTEAKDPLDALEVLSDVQLYSGRLDDSAATAARMLAVAAEAGDAHAMVMAVVNLAGSRAYQGRLHEAQEILDLRRADHGEAPSPSTQGWLAYLEGEIVLDRDPPRALAALDRAVALADSVGNRYLGGVTRVAACSLRARLADPAEALDAFAAVIDHWRRQGAQTHQLTTLRNLVVLLTRIGAAPEAAELLGTVTGARFRPSFGEEAARLAAARDRVEAALGPGEAARRLGLGAGRSLDAAAVAALGWLDGWRSP